MSVPASRAPLSTDSGVGQARGYPWSWVCVVGLVAIVDLVASTFAADAWLDDSSEWLYDTRIVVAVLALIAAPVVALGFIGRLVFGNVRHLARTGGLVWALTLGLAWTVTLELASAGEPVVDQAVRVTPETAIGLAFAVGMTFLLAWALMSLGAFAASILGRSRSRASRA